MLFKTVTYFILTVLSVSSECDQGCQQSRQNIRVKRGKYYSSPPIRFYNHPPMTAPIKGPFSYTPPPFMSDNESSYPGSRYKVSKRLTPINNDGLGDDDIANLVKYMSKQDLNKILEYAQGNDQSQNKFKNYNTNEYIRPYKQENKIPYKGNGHIKHEEPTSYKEDLLHFFNYITEPANTNFIDAQETQYSKPAPLKSQNTPVTQRTPNEMGTLYSDQGYRNSQAQPSFPNLNHYETEPMYLKVYDAQEPSRINSQIEAERYTPKNQMHFTVQENIKGLEPYPVANNPLFTETNEEEKLSPPINMRGEDYEAAYTNNVPKVEQPESYDVENFGELPLMDYSSKLHDVSSYHVPHYTVTQNKSQKPKAPSAPISFPSSVSHSSSSSTLLKPSPAAGDILEPVYEPAPSISAAAEQSDAHLKATKIWSYKSQGAAYTLHDDGSLSPERSRPKYG